MKLGDNEDFARSVNFKSVIRVGTTMVDVKSSIGWSYSRDDEQDGYIRVEFIYPSGTVLSAKLRNRKDFYQFLLETELFIDKIEYAMPNIKKFVKEIEKECLLSDDGKVKTLFARPDSTDFEDDDDD